MSTTDESPPGEVAPQVSEMSQHLAEAMHAINLGQIRAIGLVCVTASGEPYIRVTTGDHGEYAREMKLSIALLSLAFTGRMT